MHSLIKRTGKQILNLKYIKIYFNRNSVCMGDDCNPHDEYLRFTSKTSMLDMINRLKNLVPYTGGKKEGVFTLSFKTAEKDNDLAYVLGSYYKTDEYSYSYAVEPKKTINDILNEYHNKKILECMIFDYCNKDEHFYDTSKEDGIPSFIKVYASVGTSDDIVPFENLKHYLEMLVDKYKNDYK